MPVQFILGRAGTGKTHQCVTEIAEALRRNPLGDDKNGQLLWIVPAQATFMAERLLVNQPDLGGIIRGRVLSFRRLTLECARDLNLPNTQEMDDLARMVLLEDLVLQYRDDLKLFGAVADRPGFLQKLNGMLRELMLAGHTGPSLRHVADEQEHDPILAGKLYDLGLLLDAWDHAVAERGLVSDRLPQIVTPKLGGVQFLNHARIWVDAFSALTRIEEELLVALAKRVDQITITLLADPDSVCIRNPAHPLEDCSLFKRTELLYRRLRAAFNEARVRILPDVMLRDNHRVGHIAPLAAIEKELFGSAQNPVSDAAECVELWRCQNPEVEVRACAQKIRDYVARGRKYHEIGLIIPALEQYAEPVRRIFQQHHIPHFIDQRRMITHHPLVELLRMAGDILANGANADNLLLLLKTGLTPIREEDIHQFENYLLAHGVTRINLREPFVFVKPNVSEDDPLQQPTEAEKNMHARANVVLKRLEPMLRGLLVLASTGKTEGSQFSRGLYDALVAMNVDEKMDALAAGISATETQLLHRQAWTQCVNLLETLDRVLGGRDVAPQSFTRLMTASLETLSAGLIPPALDQVLVSSVSRSRHPEMKIVFVLGAVETQMPPVRPEDPMLTDSQRNVFNQHAAYPVEPGADQQLLESRFFDYVSFTRSGERMIITYPAADQQEKPVAPSAYLPRLEMLLNLKTKNIDTAVLYEPDRLATLDDALISALTNMQLSTSPNRRIAAELLAWLTSRPETEQAFKDVQPALMDPPEPALLPDLAHALYGDHLKMSVSQLEKYAACPLQYFFHYSLGLRPRERFELNVMSLGTLYHAVLQRFFDRVIARTIRWPQCDQDELLKTLRECVTQATKELYSEMAHQVPQFARLQERVIRMLSLVLEEQRRAACVGRMTPAATEAVFDNNQTESVPRKIALRQYQVDTPANRRLSLSGKIDRIDLSQSGQDTAIIDYKLGADKKLELRRVYFGLSLQLPVYLLVIRDAGLKPIASFFVPLTLRRVKGVDAREPGSDEFYQQLTPRGVLDAAAIGELDVDAEKESRWYPYARKQDNALKAGTDALEHEDFELLLKYVEHKIGQMADELATGRIAPHPYQQGAESPCEHCDFTSLCPFDRVTGQYRRIPKMKREDVLAAMNGVITRGGASS